MSDRKKVKVRFAPSPTGIPHIGNTRTALFNYLFAKHEGGEFILRIEDTDRKRIVKGAEEAILKILDWLGLSYEKNIIHQSDRLELYKKYAQEFLDKKIAQNKDGAIWINMPQDKKFKWTDLVGNKTIEFLGKDQEDFVIIKSDGYPTYHFANVVDDHLMNISHVIRGEEWISSTPKHIFIYDSFGWEKPHFAHLPVILGPDKSKLSKRHGAKSALDYKQEGYLKEALINYMALLGWNPGKDREQMSLKEMIDLFKLEDINNANPIFDVKKLEWLNGVWIRNLNQDELKKRLDEFYNDDRDIKEVLESEKFTDWVKAAGSRMKTLADFKSLVDNKVSRKLTKDEKSIALNLSKFLISQLGSGNWESEKFLAALKNFSREQNLPFKTIYYLLSGKESGIGLLELNEIYGKDFFIENLKGE